MPSSRKQVDVTSCCALHLCTWPAVLLDAHQTLNDRIKLKVEGCLSQESKFLKS